MNADITKIEAADMLNKSLIFFKQNESFNMEKFAHEVMGDSAIAKDFKVFRDNYQKENNLAIKDEFNISSQIVKKRGVKFKQLIKLDKNFEIQIHANSELIEKGVEMDGRKYYKIYYNEEN